MSQSLKDFTKISLFALLLVSMYFGFAHVTFAQDSAPPLDRPGDNDGSVPATGNSGGTGGVSTGGSGSGVSTGGSGGGVSTGGSGSPGSASLVNPLKSGSVTELLLKIIDVLIIFLTPIIVLAIMYAGFLFVTAAGNPGKIETARTALLWAIVGGVIVLGAKLIITVIQGTVAAF
jgi:hypothetical protein